MDRALSAQLARVTDPDPLMRLDAAERLGALGHLGDEAGAALINALRDEEWRVAAAAATSLGRLADRRAAIPLCQQLGHARTEVRRAAAAALSAIGDGQATASLIMALDSERDGEARRLIVVALGNVGDERALAPLKRLSGDPHWAVRREATAASAKLLARHSKA